MDQGIKRRGGARPGAGRKHKTDGKIQVTYKLDRAVVAFLRSHERPASQLIEDAVRNYFNIN